MPSQLTQAVRSALSSFVSTRESDGDNIAADVLRAVRDEAANMLEKQCVWDTFDSDPFKLCEGNAATLKQIRRVKSVIDTASCSRSLTKDGYASIDAVVSLKKDTRMQDVNDHVKLTFSYERTPLPVINSNKDDIATSVCFDADDNTDEMSRSSSSAEKSTSGKRKERPDLPRGKKKMNCPEKKVKRGGTLITYSIDVSKDHGMKERVLHVEVIAAGDGPSPKEALPMDDGSDGVWEDLGEETDSKETDAQKMEESDDAKDDSPGPTKGDSSDDRDRFGAYIDPEVLAKFLKWTQVELDESSLVFFLMTFPFYEHEWDLVGFILDTVFDTEDDSSASDSD